MEREFRKLEEFLRSHGYRATKTRLLIYEEVLSSPEIHPNAFELFERLRKKGHGISLATIYRTLNLLVRSGLVSAISFGEGHSHFEPGLDKTGHGHLVCLSCGKVIEFTHEQIQGIIRTIGENKDFQTDNFSIQVFGYCRHCRKA